MRHGMAAAPDYVATGNFIVITSLFAGLMDLFPALCV